MEPRLLSLCAGCLPPPGPGDIRTIAGPPLTDENGQILHLPSCERCSRAIREGDVRGVVLATEDA